MTIGVIGCGVVGTAVADFFFDHGVDVIKCDPKFGHGEDRYKELDERCSLVFVCVPTPTVNGKQDQTILHEVFRLIQKHLKDVVICLKSTVTPGTCTNLVAQYQVSLVHNPEFLTAKSPYEDFKNQDAIILSGPIPYVNQVLELYSKVLPHCPLLTSTRYEETELAKYMHNCFLATKVVFMNQYYQACEKLGVSYDGVKRMAVAQNRIGHTHMTVPGADGFGYGGMCFPKDMKALGAWSEEHNMGLELIQQADWFNEQLLKLNAK